MSVVHCLVPTCGTEQSDFVNRSGEVCHVCQKDCDPSESRIREAKVSWDWSPGISDDVSVGKTVFTETSSNKLPSSSKFT